MAPIGCSGKDIIIKTSQLAGYKHKLVVPATREAEIGKLPSEPEPHSKFKARPGDLERLCLKIKLKKSQICGLVRVLA